ncbi:tRNA (adenosine(37)-N6)-dimethylallyltransferase MiaA [Halomonas sp. ATBC28]|uniref:tRNA (adenosine(37)-N6)-dimethylallyltransferase MiaA n=1 Tax=Halomonadaceae TaxID=28256 RepID=UPI00048245BC|nr:MULTISPECIES: tRNA (adenosine(37)-N6)-dimethylallyltransferase MiaA [Halomonas]NAO97426.1 tRNA (adenosine(37)-N6)-dimethylallyltransferase MiaA [Halomonas sp. MG34]QGQ70149.1 tRNA (adenosine(37)-N6)-dimethylallyltransferase MiaA [Halomonas sp. PA16-9]MCE7519540.1 tRNA (adenosine(37)-N6)-dimethylallyltransferase MiaA [Halomonas titanicae]PKH59024.1 tRNA (adenosine(37)-N6)-dimethylallyltransferase MiaA [Halomonas sp. Choline-3u-9]TMU25092.1 tRNA (adenosine(37)-N6)-dimethylallyltransferase Mia|tara:strand:- start:3666 stop:4604 length:939 start_codon:yes stop_codon:yes gene_type:complete
MADTRPWAIFLMGPTAAGKTDAAMALHERLGHELISVDSAMVYRGMDIGSAKPSASELARAPHHLIDIRDPAEPYSAADFRVDALSLMRQISAAGKVPLLVGGTMLYYKRLVEGVANLPSADPAIRQRLEAQWQNEGLLSLHQRLAEVDALSAQRIHPNDPQRVMRALEVYYASGRPMSELWAEQQPETFPWRVLSIALAPSDRSLLHQRIAQRFEVMLGEGLINEVAALKKRNDLHLGLPAMKSVGYRQVWEYLEGEYDYASLVERGVIATRQLAKRQLTWLRSWPELNWVDSQRSDALDQVLKLVRDSSA